MLHPHQRGLAHRAGLRAPVGDDHHRQPRLAQRRARRAAGTLVLRPPDPEPTQRARHVLTVDSHAHIQHPTGPRSSAAGTARRPRREERVAGSKDEPVRPRRPLRLGGLLGLGALARLLGRGRRRRRRRVPRAFGASPPDAFGAVARLGALAAAPWRSAVHDSVALLRTGVREAAGFAARPRSSSWRRTGAAPLADSPLAASFSEATAVSRALVALLIAASARGERLGRRPGLDAAVFSCVAAVVTLVAAAETVRGVAAPVLLAVACCPAPGASCSRWSCSRSLRPSCSPPSCLPRSCSPRSCWPRPARPSPARRGSRRCPRARRGRGLGRRRASRRRLLAASVVPGMVAVVFVGTDLPPDMDQLRGRHSTESNLLHLMTRKNNGEDSRFL